MIGILEFFTLRRRLREERARSADDTAMDHAERQLGFSILRDAHRLASATGNSASALLAYRSAVRLLLPAELRRRGVSEASASWEQLWSAASAAQLLGRTRPELEQALRSETGEAVIARARPRERGRLLRELRALAAQLGEASFRSALGVERLLWLRRFRLGALALVLLLGIGSVLGRGPKNLALHRPVTLSDSEPHIAIDPKHLVDDDDLNLAFHTANRTNPHVTIDLGGVRSVTRVDVFNRSDCCQDRAVPLVLQLSDDGKTFTTVERRTRQFQDWRVTLPKGSRARYVRLLREGTSYFHLSEVRVF
jgi:hypothetical protein